MWNMGQGPEILTPSGQLAIRGRERPPTHAGRRVFHQRIAQMKLTSHLPRSRSIQASWTSPSLSQPPRCSARFFPPLPRMRVLTQLAPEGSISGQPGYPTPAKDPIQLTGRMIVCQQARSSSIQEGYALTSLLPADNLGLSSRFTAPPRVSDPETEPAP